MLLRAAGGANWGEDSPNPTVLTIIFLGAHCAELLTAGRQLALATKNASRPGASPVRGPFRHPLLCPMCPVLTSSVDTAGGPRRIMTAQGARTSLGTALGEPLLGLMSTTTRPKRLETWPRCKCECQANWRVHRRTLHNPWRSATTPASRPLRLTHAGYDSFSSSFAQCAYHSLYSSSDSPSSFVSLFVLVAFLFG